jgi:hypothetical protein
MSIQRQKPACLWIHDCQWVKYGDHLAELAAKEREWWVRLGKFRKALDAAGLHGHYNLLQEHFQDESGKWEAKEREIERLTAQYLVLRRAYHNVEGHNQFFERCESPYCNPQPTVIAALSGGSADITVIPGDRAKLEKIQRLTAQVERLKAPLSKSEAAELNNAGNAMNKLSEPYHKCVNRIIAARAAEKGGEA